MSNERKILLISTGVIIIIAVVLLIVLSHSPEIEGIELSRMNDLPIIIYKKLEKQNEENRLFSLNLYQIGCNPQTIVSAVDDFMVSPDRSVIAFTLENDNLPRHTLYLFERGGSTQLISKDIIYDDYAFYNNNMVCYHHYNQNILYILQEKGVKKIDNIESYLWKISGDGGTVVYTSNYDEYPDEEYSWGELNIFRNGFAEKVTEHAFISYSNRCISYNGQSIIYIEDYIEKTHNGELYLKKGEQQPELIYDKSTMDAEISLEGDFIAAIVSDDNGEDALLYKYMEEPAVIISGVSDFLISGDGTTIIYTVDAGGDWDYDLYSIKAGETPVKIAEHASLAGAVSYNGNVIAYYANLNSDEWLADLYIIRGEIIEYIDSQVRAHEFGGTMYLYDDGSLVGYLKNYNVDTATGDLFIKADGADPQKVDNNVYLFDFFE